MGGGTHNTRSSNPASILVSFACSVALTFILMQPAAAEELEVINRPVNMQGLTGLLFTTSPYTLPSGTLEVGAGVLSEQSSIPDFVLNKTPSLTVSYGLGSDKEISIKGSYIHTRFGQETQERGAGDVELSWKWNFYRPNESASAPAAGIFFTGMVPVSTKNETNIGGVDHWGARLGMTTGREIPWGDHTIALFADASLFVRDLNDDRVRDRYGSLNVGFLLPISKNRNLQMLAEYTMMSGVDNPNVDIIDHSAILYGLRVVTERFNITIGTQFLRKHAEGYDNSSSVIGSSSFKF